MGYIMGYIKIGKGIKAIFDKNTGSVKLYSNNGILQRNWIEHLGVGTEQIKSIHVVKGTVFLPENAGGMFQFYNNLTYLDMNKFDTSKVTDMGAMFFGCEKLKSLDLSNFKTSNVKRMSKMFTYCSSLKVLDLSSFDTSNVTDINRMFEY